MYLIMAVIPKQFQS